MFVTNPFELYLLNTRDNITEHPFLYCSVIEDLELPDEVES